MDPAALKSELLIDPQSMGLTAPFNAGAYTTVCALLNGVSQAIDIDRDLVPAHEVFEAIVPGEWASLSAAEKQRLQTMLGCGLVNARGANTRAAFQAMFANGTTSRVNLIALQKRKGSRAEQLWGAGVVVTAADVAKARDA